MRSEVPETLRKIVADQSGVVSRRQAIQEGLSADVIKSRVRAGRWQSLYRGVYVTFTGTPTRRARLWAAVLYAGDGAMLSHETAAELHGLITIPVPLIHITVPEDRRVSPVPGLVIHRTARAADRRFPEGVLPVTWKEETVLDLTDAAKDFDDVCGWVTAAFARGMVTEGTMLAFVSRRKKLRWRQDLIHLVDEAARGAHSVLEYRYDRDVERAHGLPRSQHQAPYRKPDGRRGYRDRYYEQYKVIVELDGRAYHPEETRWRDRDRDNAAVIDYDSRSLRYGWRDVRGAPCRTAMQVAKVLTSRGWPGSPAPCSPRCPVARS
jgi:hypothetical protein